MNKKKLLESIEVSFPEDIVLGKNYSLADSDFFDSNRYYPDNESAKIQLSKFPYKFEGWDKSTIEFTLNQIRTNEISYKNECWGDVESKYFRKHFHGVVFLNELSYLYYLPAWMSLFLKEGDGVLDIASDWMLTVIENSALCGGRDSRLNMLNDKQKKVISNFLIFMYEYNDIEYEGAKVFLNKGWSSYL